MDFDELLTLYIYLYNKGCRNVNVYVYARNTQPVLVTRKSMSYDILQVQLQAQSSVMSGQEKYTLDQFAVTDIKAILREQQQAIQVHPV